MPARPDHLDIDGIRIAVRHSPGQGRAALLVHGNSTSAIVFHRQFESELGAEFHLVAIDLPGHGASERPGNPSETYSVPGFASIVVRAAHALEIEEEFFIGWSLGGHIVLEAAHLLPRAAGFCIVATPPLRFPPNLEQAFLPHPAANLLFQEQLTEQEVRHWVAAALRPGADPAPEFLDAIRQADPVLRSSLLASIGSVGYRDEANVVAALDQPLAVVNGTHDVLIDLTYVESLPMPSLWRGEIQRIANAGHAPQWEAPETFNRVVGEFLRGAGN